MKPTGAVCMHSTPHGPSLPSCPQCQAEIAREVETFQRECVGVTHNATGHTLNEWIASGFPKETWQLAVRREEMTMPKAKNFWDVQIVVGGDRWRSTSKKTVEIAPETVAKNLEEMAQRIREQLAREQKASA